MIKVTANLPRFCSSMESWILHDVHEPQSPRPLRMKSAWAASSSKYSLGAPCWALILRRVTTFPTSKRSLSSCAKRSSSLSALGLLLSSSPTTLPFRSENRGSAATRAAAVLRFPFGTQNNHYYCSSLIEDNWDPIMPGL